MHGEAGAGLVRATVTAQGKVTALVIDPALLTPTKQQVVEDLTVSVFVVCVCD